MRTGIKPRVNEAREFLEIAKDFKDPKELLREAISNSWDANAQQVSIKFDLASINGTRSRKIMVRIEDDGDGMSSEDRSEDVPSEIEGFFNLGDSYKGSHQIGSKGHGTKIYYKSSGIFVETYKSGKRITAKTECDPWHALREGRVPTYQIDEIEGDGQGTTIKIDGFEAKHKEFSNLAELISYINWYTVAGSFSHYFADGRNFDVRIKSIGGTEVSLPKGFSFPDEQLDFDQGTRSICKVFGPETIECGVSKDGEKVTVEIVGALLGEDQRDFVPHTYENMGLWFAKDFVRVERKNSILEDAFGGQYYYRNFMVLANCQQFDLTANRNNVRTSDEEYELAEDAIRSWAKNLAEDDYVTAYFNAKSDEDEAARKEKEREQAEEKERRNLDARDTRVNHYKGRSELQGNVPKGASRKAPSNEAETALLLQAMISNGHSSIDFSMGDYNTARGVDLLVERKSKAIDQMVWVELVHNLSKLAEWSHNPDGYHSIVCFELGGVGENFKITGDREARLIRKETAGRYVLTAGDETFEVYVLGEMLG